MPASGPRVELRNLRRFVFEIEARYLSPHYSAITLGPPPRSEELDVAAFAVLAHGALENFVEGLSLWAAEKVEVGWIRKKRASRSTAALMLRQAYSVDDSTTDTTVFDSIRTALEAAKAARSQAVRNNHGIALKHVRSLLSPLGVDIPTDPSLAASLNTLVQMRHHWAHQYRFGARTAISARDAWIAASDCLMLAEKLTANVARLRL